mmetsp:Transcript_73065/g.191548  ORF Transcript_73065/g.191548 Transcript_73065/m.191548 type:complete len:236 (-) Transcript_73065:185-892(-)
MPMLLSSCRLRTCFSAVMVVVIAFRKMTRAIAPWNALLREMCARRPFLAGSSICLMSQRSWPVGVFLWSSPFGGTQYSSTFRMHFIGPVMVCSSRSVRELLPRSLLRLPFDWVASASSVSGCERRPFSDVALLLSLLDSTVLRAGSSWETCLPRAPLDHWEGSWAKDELGDSFGCTLCTEAPMTLLSWAMVAALVSAARSKLITTPPPSTESSPPMQSSSFRCIQSREASDLVMH